MLKSTFLVFFALAIFALTAAETSSEEDVVAEMALAAQEVDKEADTGALHESMQQAIDSLDVCHTSRCSRIRNRCNTFAHKRYVCRNRIARFQRIFKSSCSAHTSHCVSLRHRIARLQHRYRYFGGKLRWYIHLAKVLAWGPKQEALHIPYKHKHRRGGKRIRWTAPKPLAPEKNILSTTFGFIKPQKKTSPLSPFPLNKKQILARRPPFWRRWYSLRNFSKNERDSKRLLENDPKVKLSSWWRRFIKRATRQMKVENGQVQVKKPKALKKKKAHRKHHHHKRHHHSHAEKWFSPKWEKKVFGDASRFFGKGRSKKARHDLRRARHDERREASHRRQWKRWSKNLNPDDEE